jgi:hypothetical protein
MAEIQPSGDIAMFEKIDPANPEPSEAFREMAATHIDGSIRQAVSFCWTALPKERRNADEVEKEIRRIVDRAIRDFREDSAAFGLLNS